MREDQNSWRPGPGRADPASLNASKETIIFSGSERNLGGKLSGERVFYLDSL
jgi:hypothetical protein